METEAVVLKNDTSLVKKIKQVLSLCWHFWGQ